MTCDPQAAFQRQLLILLDGSRTHADLLESLIEQVQTRNLLLHHQGRPITNPTAIHDTLEQTLTPALESLARMALLID